MTPNEAEEIMKPFFPNDLNLAVKALCNALNEDMTPEWIATSIVEAYFTFLAINQLHELAQHHDPFGWGTVQYLGYINLDKNKN